MSKRAQRHHSTADAITFEPDSCTSHAGLKTIGALGGPPNGFDEKQTEVWLAFVSLVTKAGAVHESQRVPLELLVDAYVQYKETSRILRVEGIYYTTSSSHTSRLKRKHPLVDVNRALRKQVMELSDRLGICALTNVPPDGSIKREVDVAAKYFSR